MYRKLTAGMLVLLLAGCQSEPDVQVTDTASQLKAAEETRQAVQSYSSSYKNKTRENDRQSETYLSLKKDKDSNQEITVTNDGENGKFYVYDNKAILEQQGEWIDATKLGGAELLSMTTPLLYNEQFKLLKQLTGAEYSDHTLTETITNYEDYRQIFGRSADDKKAIQALEEKFPDIRNTITVRFNKNNEIERITNDMELKNGSTTIENNAVTTFSDINNVKLDIPEQVKKARTVGDSL